MRRYMRRYEEVYEPLGECSLGGLGRTDGRTDGVCEGTCAGICALRPSICTFVPINTGGQQSCVLRGDTCQKKGYNYEMN